MWSFLVAPEFQPFTIAALVMLGMLAIEIVSTLFGVAASTLLDSILGLHDIHVGASESQTLESAPDGGVVHGSGSPFATAFNWLNAGRVPLLVLMIAAIACFAVTGMVMQILAMHLLRPLPTAVAVVVAIAAAVPGARWVSGLVSRIIPRDETYVLGDNDLVGRVGVVTLGPVVEGAAARAKVQDRYGNWHFPRIAPGSAGLSIPEGASILIVDKVGEQYTVILAEGRLAPSHGRSKPA